MNDDWINEFTNKEKDFQIFYKDTIDYIKLFIFYVNRNNNLEKVKEKNFYLTKKNIIAKDELKEIINSYRKSEKTPYRLISIFKHNIDIEPDDIARSLKDDYQYDYTESLTSLDNIIFNNSITMFEDLNSLFLIFYETTGKTNNTKRIKFKNKETHKNKIIKNINLHK